MSVWPAAVRKCAASASKFKAAADVAGFDPSQRQQILAEHLPVPFALPEARALLEMGMFHFGLDVNHSDVFVGVGRKGQSFLNEVSRHHEIGADRIINDRVIDQAIKDGVLRQKKVLIVDDAIHTGGTMVELVDKIQRGGASAIRASVVLASEGGLAHVRAMVPGLEVRPVLRVPEQYYAGTYQRSVGPAMLHYQRGSLSNRPCKTVVARAASYGEDRAAFDVLHVLSEWDLAESFGQTPLSDDDQSPIFRGAMEFGPAQIGQWNGGQPYEQAKARVFIDAREQLTVGLNAIYYPEADGPLTAEQLGDMERAACEPMLQALAAHLRDGLLARGYSVRLL